jgi:hypothetical protein
MPAPASCRSSPTVIRQPTAPGCARSRTGYRLTRSQRADLPVLIGAHTRAMYHLLHDGAATGEQPWARLYAEGHGDYWGPAAEYIDRHLGDWARALLK